MSVSFLGGEGVVWKQITKTAKSASRADVAVAFLGKGGAKRLPLKSGSRLVVDASEGTVKAGGTCPEELLKLVRRGVDVYSRGALHAKVFVFPKSAYVGSANNSSLSADVLSEALLRTTDPETVRQARDFVISMCDGIPMGPKELEYLQTIYRPPRPKRQDGGGKRRLKPCVWFEEVSEGELPDGTESFVKELLAEAKAQHKQRKHYTLIEIWQTRPRYRKDDIVVMTEWQKRREMVSYPGKVIAVKECSIGRSRYVFSILEQREQRRVALSTLVKSLGRGGGKRLAYSNRGKLDSITANKLLKWWGKRA